MVVHALEQPIDRVLDTLEHNPSYLPKSLYSISKNRDCHIPSHKDVTESHTPLYHDQLRSLGIQRVFDLRVDSEIAKYGTASKSIQGVDLVRVPIIQDPWRPSEVPQR